MISQQVLRHLKSIIDDSTLVSWENDKSKQGQKEMAAFNEAVHREACYSSRYVNCN